MGDRRLERLFRRYVRRGDAAALGEVFDRVAPELARLARHLSGRSSDVEDLVQTTFLTAIERARDFETERALVPWLVGILARHAANARRKRRDLQPLDPEQHSSGSAATLGAVEAAESRELEGALARAVGDLPASYRAIVRAHLVDARPTVEIARELRITPGAARVRLHRGLALVRRALPPSLTAGSAFALERGSELATARAVVLATARAAAPRLAAGSALLPAASWIGGVVVLQRVVVSSIVVLAAALSLVWWRSSGDAVRQPVEDDVAAAPRSDARLEEPAAQPPLPAEPPPASERELDAPAADGVLFQGRVVDATTRAPIAGARVWSAPAEGSERVLLAHADERGVVEFRAPAAAEQTLEFDAEGYALVGVQLTARRRLEFWATTARAEHDGGARVALDEIALQRGIAFAGRVVRASDRSPVAGAQLVLCWWTAYRLFTVSDRVVGRTAADGSMVFHGELPSLGGADGALDAGHYVLLALHEEGLGWTRVPQASDRAAIDGIEIVLESGTRLRVSVHDGDGSPVRGARVRCLPLHDPFGPLPDHAASSLLPAAPALTAFFERDTDAEGVARFEHLPRAPQQLEGNLGCRYEVVVEIAGDVLYRRVHLVDCFGDGEVAVLADPDVRTWIRGRVVDVARAPVAAARVRVLGLDRETTSDAEGRYQLERRPGDPSRIELRASAPGYAEARRALEFDMLEPPLDGNDFVLRAPLAIRGRVLDAEARAIEGVRVWAYGDDDQIAGTGPESVTDATGSFVVPDAFEGEWRLWPVLGDAFATYEPLREGVRVRAGDVGVVVTLTRRASHAGRIELDVLDAETGLPLDPVYATAFAAQPGVMHAWKRELAPGRVVLDGMPPGRYDVWVAVAGRANGHLVVDLDAETSLARATLRMGRGARLRGSVDFARVARPDRCTVRGTIVTAAGLTPGDAPLTNGGATYFDAIVEADASFVADGLVPGTWELTLLAEATTSASVQVELGAGDLGDARLVAEPGCTLELVLDGELERGWVLVFARAEGESEDAWSTPERILQGGHGRMAPIPLTVPPGKLTWRVWFLEGPSLLAPVHVAEPAEGELELVAGERRRLTVHVR